VPHHQSEILQRALQQVGSEVSLVTLSGAGHGTPEFRTDEVARQMIAFFDRHLTDRRP
jgi:dipeptidyl aminopeptidase/acylaminoacyl peptidase